MTWIIFIIIITTNITIIVININIGFVINVGLNGCSVNKKFNLKHLRPTVCQSHYSLPPPKILQAEV